MTSTTLFYAFFVAVFISSYNFLAFSFLFSPTGSFFVVVRRMLMFHGEAVMLGDWLHAASNTGESVYGLCCGYIFCGNIDVRT